MGFLPMTAITEQSELTPLPLMGVGMHTTQLHKLSRILIIALLVTAIFNPDALVVWTQKLPVNPVTDVLFDAAHRWRDLMDELGLTIVFDKLREAFRFFQTL